MICMESLELGGTNNLVLVTGSGSQWKNDSNLVIGTIAGSVGNSLFVGDSAIVTNGASLIVGSSGFLNSLIISNGGKVYSSEGVVGFASSKKWLGYLLSVFAALIFVGSIHLGWHYAIDGYAGAAVALVCWWVAGKIVDWDRCQRGLA